MSRRNLLVAGGIALVAAAAVWYWTAAGPTPASGTGGTEPQVAVSATQTGVSGWVRYLVSVKNVADGDYRGQVLLVQAGPGAAAPSAVIAVPAAGRRLPVGSTVSAQSAYQVDVEVPSRQSRTYAIIAPDGFVVVEAVDGRVVLDAASVARDAYLPLAVLSGDDTAATDIAGVRIGGYQTHVAQIGSAGRFPDRASLLAGYSVVVVDGFDTGTLGQAQIQALRDFTDLGGTLVLAAGDGWRRTLASLPPDLLPLRPAAAAPASLEPIAALAGVGTAAPEAPVATGEPAPGARVLVQAAGGPPLLTVLARGSGQVVEVGADPAAGAIAHSAFATLLWTEAIGRSVRSLSGAAGDGQWLPAPDPAFTGLLPPVGDAPLPWPPLALAGLVLYLAIIGPLSYLVVGRGWGRPALMWLAVPLIAGCTAAVFFFTGQLLQGDLQARRLQVIRPTGDGRAAVLEYDRILFFRRGDHEIEAPAGSIAAPMTLDAYQVTGTSCERCLSQLQGLVAGAEHVLPGPVPAVTETGVVYGSVRVVASTSVTAYDAGLRADLVERGGRLAGRITNLGSEPVDRLGVFADDGAGFLAAPLGTLAPGATITVDTALASDAGGSVPGLDPVVESVGLAAVGPAGAPVLAGLTTPLAAGMNVDGSPPAGLAAAVLVQPALVTTADGSLRPFERKTLASTEGDQSHGFLDVYDLTIPPTAAPLRLSVDPQRIDAGKLEAFDWRLNRFVPLALAQGAGGPAATSAAAAITADEVDGGMVRVRVAEPQVGRASEIWVDSASPSAPG